jgi:hypothetical protein
MKSNYRQEFDAITRSLEEEHQEKIAAFKVNFERAIESGTRMGNELVERMRRGQPFSLAIHEMHEERRLFLGWSDSLPSDLVADWRKGGRS